MQIELDACSYSQRLMSSLDDSHFPGSQSVLRVVGVYIYHSFGAFNQKHASSTIQGNGVMNTMKAEACQPRCSYLVGEKGKT